VKPLFRATAPGLAAGRAHGGQARSTALRGLAGLGLLAAASAGAAGAGCDDATTPSTAVYYTSIFADPQTFKGNLTCGPYKGAMRSVVMTLIDVSADGADVDPKARFVLPSTPPTGCNSLVSYGAVVPGHVYVAELDVYDRPACSSPGAPPDGCIAALALGSRIMLSGPSSVDDGVSVAPSGTLHVVEPTWTTTCGDPALRKFENGYWVAPVSDGGALLPGAPTEAVSLFQVPLSGCNPIESDTSTGGVEVTIANLTGALTCGTSTPDESAGRVARIEVSRDADTTGVIESATCLERSVTFEGLAAKSKQSFHVLAFESGLASPTWGTTCQAVPPPGVVVEAACQPLTTKGSLQIPSAAVCLPGADTFDAQLTGEAGTLQAAKCGASSVFDGLAPGLWTVGVTSRNDGGEAVASTVCRGQVLPGAVVTATCEPAKPAN
jgi:hypothetical protein